MKKKMKEKMNIKLLLHLHLLFIQLFLQLFFFFIFLLLFLHLYFKITFLIFLIFSLLIINLYSTYFPTIFQTIISILSPLIINAIFQSSNKINFGLHIEIHFLIIEINYPFNISLTYSPAILQTASFINFIVTWRIRWTNSIFNSISINRNSNDILHKPSRRIRRINILLIIIINSYDIAGNIIINIIIKPVSIPIIILIISFRDIVHLDLFI